MLASGPNNYNNQFTLAADGTVALSTTPFPIGGGTVTGPVVIKTNTAPTLPAPPVGTLLQLGNADGSGTRIVLDAFGAGVGFINFRRTNGTAAAPTAVIANDTLGTIGAFGYGATGYSTSRTAITSYAAQNWTDANQGAFMSFLTTPNNTTAQAEAMRIDHNGNVGIGTAAPVPRLEVRGNTYGLPLTSGVGTIEDGSFRMASALHGEVLDMGIGIAAAWLQARSAGAPTYSQIYPLLLNPNGGNVGIGTTAPGAKLHSQVASAGTLGFFVGNSTYSTTGFNGLGMQVNDTGTAIIRGGWGTAKDILLNDAGGNVGIGTANPTSKLYIVNTAAGATTLTVQTIATAGETATKFAAGPAGADSTTVNILFVNATGTNVNGSIARTGTNSVAFNTTSDARLKDAVVESERGLDALMAIRVSDYKMGDTAQQGLLAQDVHEVYPEAVHEGGDDPDLEPWMLDYGRLAPLIIRGFQQGFRQLEARIETLESK